MSSGIILDLITQFGSSSDKRLDWKKVTFSGEIVAGNYPVNEWSWELREWAETMVYSEAGGTPREKDNLVTEKVPDEGNKKQKE